MIVSVTSDCRYIARIETNKLIISEFADLDDVFIEILLPKNTDVRRAYWDPSAIWSERFLALGGSASILIVKIESDGTFMLENMGPFECLKKFQWLSRAESPSPAVLTALGLYVHGAIGARPKQLPVYFSAIGGWLLLCRENHRDIVSVINSTNWVDFWKLPGKNATCLAAHYSQPIYSYYDDILSLLVVASLTQSLARRKSLSVRHMSWVQGPGLGFILSIEAEAVLLRTADLQVAQQLPDTWSGEVWSMCENNSEYAITEVNSLKLTDENMKISVSPKGDQYVVISRNVLILYQSPCILNTVVKHPGPILQVNWHSDGLTVLGEEFVGLLRPAYANPLAIHIRKPKGTAYGRGRLITWSLDELAYDDIQPLYDVTTGPTFIPT